MTVETRPAPAAYRSEAVFRSAERLLASTPARSRRRAPRSVFFVVGLLCGVGLALWLWPRGRERSLAPTTEAGSARALRDAETALAGDSAAATGKTTVLPLRSAPLAPATAPTATAPSAGTTTAASPDAARSATPARPVPTVERPLRVVPPSYRIAPLPATTGTAESPAVIVQSLGFSPWPSHLTFSGTLYTPGLPGMLLTLDLRVTSTENEAAFFEGTAQVQSSVLRIAPFRVTGTFSGSSIVLENVHAPAAPPVNTLVIALPSKSDGRFTGTWTLEGRHGTLGVKIVPEAAR